MKKLFTMKALLLLAGVLLAFGSAQAQSALPAGFPTYTDTGNPAEDVARYGAAKAAWHKAHPELLSQTENLTFDQVQTPAESNEALQKMKAEVAKEPRAIKTFTLEEFKAMPSERQSFIRENRDIVRIVDGQGKLITNF